MAIPYIGEIRMFGGNFAPRGWLFCDGQLLSVSGYDALFQLIGTTYGGDGQDTFALPDLRGRIPIHQGDDFTLAERGGTEQVTLTMNQMPAHDHAFQGANVTGNETSPQNALPANSLNITPYINAPPDGDMNAAAITHAGGSQPHTNVQPFLCINFIISLFGVFPSPN